MNTNFTIVAKTAQCIRCGKEFTFGVYAVLNSNGPKICPDCGNTHNQEAQSTQKKKAARSRAVTAEIPNEYLHYIAEKDPYNTLNAIMQQSKWNLYLVGSYQAGKSHCAGYAAYCLLENETIFNAHFIQVPSWLRETGRLMASAPDEAALRIQRATKCDLLILDDIGKEKLTERTGETLFEIFDKRLQQGKRIWVTSNYDGRGLAEKLGYDLGNAIRARMLKHEFKMIQVKGGVELK